MQRLGYQPSLDGVRGLAVAAVVVAHAGVPATTGGGLVGVTMFFVLSGFLITRLLDDEQQANGAVSLRAFYRRRFWRLAPALAVVLAAVVMFRGPLFSDLWVVGYGANVAKRVGTDLQLLDHTWSLAFEEQFYVVWPAVLLVVRRQARAVAGAAVLACWLWRVGVADHEMALYYGPTRFAALAAGCAAARIAWRPGEILQMAGCAVLAWVMVDRSNLAMSLFLVEAASVVVILGLVGSRRLAWRPLVVLGQASYALYLWHIPMMRSGIGASWHPAWRWVAGSVAIGSATWVTWRWIETPLRDHSVERRRRSGEGLEVDHQCLPLRPQEVHSAPVDTEVHVE